MERLSFPEVESPEKEFQRREDRHIGNSLGQRHEDWNVRVEGSGRDEMGFVGRVWKRSN